MKSSTDALRLPRGILWVDERLDVSVRFCDTDVLNAAEILILHRDTAELRTQAGIVLRAAVKYSYRVIEQPVP